MPAAATASSEDIDVSRAFIAKWNATPAITTVVVGGIAAETKPSPKPHRSPPQRPAMPYATLRTAQGPRTNEYSSDKSWIDYRKVTVEIRGVDKEQLGRATLAVADAFSNQPLSFLDISDRVAHMRTEPLTSNIAEDKSQISGNDLYRATLEWCIWTHRQPPPA